jgi:hypothetical protein
MEDAPQGPAAGDPPVAARPAEPAAPARAAGPEDSAVTGGAQCRRPGRRSRRRQRPRARRAGLAPAGLERRITLPYIQKTGLAVAGFDEYLRSGRVLVFGESEIRFPRTHVAARARLRRCGRLFTRDLARAC